ncbi:MAG: ribonuclease Z [Planctomycetota bacterium]|jgi:ribonuclease Z
MTRKFFKPRLVNGPAGDPALYVELIGEGRSLLFDMGRLDRLKPAELLRISHVFVSHTHFDHFIGFDHFLRLRLGNDRPVKIFGPEGFLENIEGKLNGYTWNLVDGAVFEIECFEIRGTRILRKLFRCSDGFKARGPVREGDLSDGLLEDGGSFTVHGAALDHRIPSLAFCVRERERMNVDVGGLKALGLADGPWVGKLKSSLLGGGELNESLEIEGKSWTLGELKEGAVRITPGEVLGYVADARYNRENEKKVLALVHGADLLFCEGGFLHEDEAKAREKDHLTARDAGQLARLAGAKELTTFHFSPKYVWRFAELEEEGQAAFEGK